MGPDEMAQGAARPQQQRRDGRHVLAQGLQRRPRRGELPQQHLVALQARREAGQDGPAGGGQTDRLDRTLSRALVGVAAPTPLAIRRPLAAAHWTRRDCPRTVTDLVVRRVGRVVRRDVATALTHIIAGRSMSHTSNLADMPQSVKAKTFTYVPEMLSVTVSVGTFQSPNSPSGVVVVVSLRLPLRA